jgi:tripartite-type tricarboxylate transporter receptor subunit TctC
MTRLATFVIALTWAAFWVPCASCVAVAQSAADFPTGPVKIIVPFPPGGPADVIMRILADQLSPRWGKPVIVENRPGAGTIIATSTLARAQPDGLTLLDATYFHIMNAALNRNLPFDPIKDFAGVSMVVAQPIALFAHPSFEPNTVAELIVLAKRSPEPLNYGSSGPRGVAHLAGELFQSMAGIKMQHISYTGSGPAMTDLLAGRVPIMFDIWHAAKQHVEEGKLKVLGVGSRDRLKDSPQYPAIAETLPGFDASSFQSLIAPAGVPGPILAKIAADVRIVVGSPEFAARTKAFGVDPQASTPQELDTFLRAEIAKWSEIAAKANLKVD